MFTNKIDQFKLFENDQVYCYEDFKLVAANQNPLGKSDFSVIVNGSTVKNIVSGIIAASFYKCSVYLFRESAIKAYESKLTDAFLPPQNHFSQQKHNGLIWLQTSGTSGEPKWFAHRLEDLFGAIAPGSERVTWMLTYEPTSFAGLQVILSALLGGHQLVCPKDKSSTSEYVNLAEKHNITNMSGTPTFWRAFLRASVNASLSIKKVTLGGEVADQATLDELVKRFKNAEIRHIYATTELGVVLTVKDGKAGFPSSWIGKTLPNGLELSLSSMNSLLIAGPKVGSRFNDEKFDTRDVIAIEEERAFFKGRADTLINVGGSKVYPEEVESFLLQLSCISDVIVSGHTSPITGHILIADIVPSMQVEELEIRKEIHEHLKVLPRYARPALLRFKKELFMGGTGKKPRLL
jgi:acyl-coenzyme A synthetase/AMP-(fatty) acid ligase